MIEDLQNWWISLQPAIQAATIGASATVAAALIAAIVVACQIKKQAANAIRQNSHNEALKLKMKIYEDIIGICARCGEAEVAINSFVLSLFAIVDTCRNQHAAGHHFSIPWHRFARYLELQTSLEKSASAMIALTERWQTVDPRIQVFGTAFNVAMHDFREVSWRYANTIGSILPIERPDTGQLYPWSPPDDQLLNTLDDFGKSVFKAVHRMGAFAQDFQVEMQNILVGELFGNTVFPRVPIDPHDPVVTLENHALLANYFAKDTDWGRNRALVERDVRTSLEVRAEKNR